MIGKDGTHSPLWTSITAGERDVDGLKNAGKNARMRREDAMAATYPDTNGGEKINDR